MNGQALLGVVWADAASSAAVRAEDLAALLGPEALSGAERHRAIAAAAQRGVIAPARRSARFDHPAAAQAWLSRNAEPLRALLRRLEGRAELLLTGEAPAPAGQPAAVAGGYLRAQAARLRGLQAQQEALAEAAERLLAPVRALAPEVRQAPWRTPQAQGLDVSLLLPAQHCAAAQDALRAAAAPGWRLTGPWPPYSFSELPT